MEFIVKEVTEPRVGIVASLNALLPQLSENSNRLDLNKLTEITESTCSHLLTAIVEESIVGMLTVTVVKIPTGTKAMIEDVVVDKNFRKFGIAKQLVAVGVNLARQYNAKDVELTSRPSRQAANKLYTSMGFVQRETNVYRLKVN